MKYMTFNSSCAFAGIANMLARYDIDVEDRDIALGMDLPYLFDKDGDSYLAGPMLQSAQWFNRYLHTIGFHLQEEPVAKATVPDYLREKTCAMLGLCVSPESKHAVIYIGCELADGKSVDIKNTNYEYMERDSNSEEICNYVYLFLNNKWQQSDEPERFEFTKQELLERLDETVMIATLVPLAQKLFSPEIRNVSNGSDSLSIRTLSRETLYRHSCAVLEEWKQDVQEFCGTEKTPTEIRLAMNTLFRAVLLDAVTMLELEERHVLADTLRAIQREFLGVVRSGKTVVLAKEMSIPMLLDAVDQYIDCIRNVL